MLYRTIVAGLAAAQVATLAEATLAEEEILDFMSGNCNIRMAPTITGKCDSTQVTILLPDFS